MRTGTVSDPHLATILPTKRNNLMMSSAAADRGKA